jgi:hypothetical protein
MTEQAGYYGKRRKWHSWGYEDEVISDRRKRGANDTR